MRPIAFFAGKGGVGKTTLATAWALRLAATGRRTLLVSTDPAHSTGDLLDVPLGGSPVQVAPGLDAVEVDTAADAAAYVARIADDARASLSPEVLPVVERHLALAAGSPGTVESALVDRVAELVARCPDAYDRVVVDTAPTGTMLRLVALPDLLTGWVGGLLRIREGSSRVDRMARAVTGTDGPEDDPVLRRLRARRDALRGLRDRLVHDAVFHVVLVPERLAIEETSRSLVALTDAGVTVGSVVVNRVLPVAADGEYLRARVEQQSEHLAEIERRFAAHPRFRVDQAPRDLVRVAELLALGARLPLPD